MNIQSFSMPDPAYFNPTVFGDLTGINYVVWLVSHLFFDMKFFAIFSILFGAGIVLMCSRTERRGEKPARIHYRRILWLLLFGLVHAYLLWHGDILVWYSFSAFLAYLFWRLRPGWLVFWALLFFSVGTGIYLLAQFSLPHWPQQAIDGNLAYWNPSAEVMAHRLEAYRGGWTGQLAERAPESLILHTFIYLIFGLWRSLGLMLAGMALFKWGVLSAKRSNRFYLTTAITGLAVGLPVIGYGAVQNFAHDWFADYSLFGGSLFNYWGSLFVAMAYIAIVMLLSKGSWFTGLKRRMALVGRAAFSCYIFQTLICTILFYGHGFGLFGYVPRWGQLLITIAVWILVVVASNIWLDRYSYGPLEWLWRSLTYRKSQPMRISAQA